ncbi:MAG: DapH/DapD/GlmU-related protein [Leadbetterella sp.]|nr:DapH/DapD/GlmU-related protein [Leadbetterella sp.]
MINLFNVTMIFFNKIKHSYLLNNYNDFTIGEYFRKQGAQVGENNRLEIRSLGPEPYLVTIGNHCTVAEGVRFLTHDGAVWIFTEEIPDLQKFGPIEIRDNCFIGSGVIIMANVRIGPNAIVGAGSIVTKDVPENTIVAGNPAKYICNIKEYREKVVKIWKQQKPHNYFQNTQGDEKYNPEYIQELKYRDFAILRKHLEQLFSDTHSNN